MLRSHLGEYRISLFAILIELVALGACAPVAGPGEVATRATPPPWKNAATVQTEDALCKRAAHGDTRTYVHCMEQRGYRVDLFGAGGIPMTTAQLPLPSSPAAPSPSPTIPSVNESAAVSQQEQTACKQYANGSSGVYAECIRKRAFAPGGRITDISPDSLNADEFYCHRQTAMTSGIPTPILTGKITNNQRAIYVQCMSERGYAVAGLPGSHRYAADGEPTDFEASSPLNRPSSQAGIGPLTTPSASAPGHPSSAVARLHFIINQYKDEIFYIAHPSAMKAGVIDGTPRIDVIDNGSGSATITERVSWTGFSTNKHYDTTLQFMLSYNGNTVTDVTIKISETNNPWPSAFQFAEHSKKEALEWVQNKLQKGHMITSALVGIFNQYSSIKTGLCVALQYLSTNTS